MKHVTILVLESCVPQGITDARYLFRTVNQFLQAQGQKPFFQVELAGLKKEVLLADGMFSVHAERLLKDIDQTDLIIIPPLFGDMEKAVASNSGVLPWITAQYAKGAEVASLCVGAFLLAATGLLNGHQCSTHWAYVSEFRQRFPDVEVVDGSIITEANGLYSSGGALSFWNLLLHLVEKFTSRETAILVSKYFAVDIDRESQNAFALFQGQKNHNDEAVKTTQVYIEEHYYDKLTVDELAERVALGRRSFERRFKQATNNSVLEYIHRIKMEAAKRSFESTRKNITEVMYEVGYTDTKAFRSVFKKLTGLTPVEYRNKYNRLAVEMV